MPVHHSPAAVASPTGALLAGAAAASLLRFGDLAAGAGLAAEMPCRFAGLICERRNVVSARSHGALRCSAYRRCRARAIGDAARALARLDTRRVSLDRSAGRREAHAHAARLGVDLSCLANCAVERRRRQPHQPHALALPARHGAANRPRAAAECAVVPNSARRCFRLASRRNRRYIGCGVSLQAVQASTT